MNINENIVPYNASLEKLAFSFNCGTKPIFNAFLKSNESLDENYGKTFVFLTDDKSKIIGYYNIGIGELLMNDGYQTIKCGGAVHINYLAIDQEYRGVKLLEDENGKMICWSDVLLQDCIAYIREIREKYIGFSFVTLFSSNEGYKLYKRNGFYEIEEDMLLNYGDSEKSGDGIPMYYALAMDEL